MIRPGTEQDIGAVQEIARQSWRSTYADILPVQVQQIALDKSYSRVMMEKRIERTILLIAEHEGSPIGFANFTKVDEDGDAELIAMHIKPEFQRNGYGTQLMTHGIEKLADGRKLSAFVEASNEAARCFYEANGFVFVQEFEELLEGYPVFTAEYTFPLQHQKAPAL